ncbi:MULTISPECIES: hypothetical protein [Helicobacter]|uniref:Lipoprotein n=1 Tax=Helicobacter typhlonius TaxID=76936 RepID=A0A099UH35_9HELI|nr:MULTISPECIES: hypothetical protein [Helicobacter]TLD78928.1 hypothetical protein LS75_004050 [Helicobacter typhlonius]TLD90261.1 hypothetical protein LS67_000975 [Helicobacter sp. MIT 03-1616]CUU40948.1 Hypothetical protein BN2458_PEG2065 [Helicobacter typhlonius]HCD73417.1 hypothetical protein [Helicobacter sp.]
MRYILIIYSLISLCGCSSFMEFLASEDSKRAWHGFARQEDFKRQFESNANTGTSKGDFAPTLYGP